MNRILNFLKENPTFFLATLEDDQPRVRPMGFAMIYDDKLCFCTNNKKEVFKQMQANPNIEISTASPAGEWLRLSGKVTFNQTVDAKIAALEAAPFLSSMYSLEDGIFEIFELESGVATFYSMKSEPEVVRF